MSAEKSNLPGYEILSHAMAVGAEAMAKLRDLKHTYRWNVIPDPDLQPQ